MNSTKKQAMIKTTLTVINPLGLHARPSSLLTRTASTFKSDITIEHDGVVSNVKSIMSVMMQAACCGMTLELTVNGVDEKEATIAITKLFESGFDECY